MKSFSERLAMFENANNAQNNIKPSNIIQPSVNFTPEVKTDNYIRSASSNIQAFENAIKVEEHNAKSAKERLQNGSPEERYWLKNQSDVRNVPHNMFLNDTKSDRALAGWQAKQFLEQAPIQMQDNLFSYTTEKVVWNELSDERKLDLTAKLAAQEEERYKKLQQEEAENLKAAQALFEQEKQNLQRSVKQAPKQANNDIDPETLALIMQFEAENNKVREEEEKRLARKLKEIPIEQRLQFVHNMQQEQYQKGRRRENNNMNYGRNNNNNNNNNVSRSKRQY